MLRSKNGVNIIFKVGSLKTTMMHLQKQSFSGCNFKVFKFRN